MRVTKHYLLTATLYLMAGLFSIDVRGQQLAVRSQDDKAKAEALARERARIEEENRKITHANEVVSRAFKAGNEALNAGRLDDAVAHYREGLAARPDEPALLNNLSEALRRRGVDRYNAALQDQNNDTKLAGIEAAKKDWSEAAESSKKALDVIKGSTLADPAQQRIYEQNRRAALSTYALSMRLVATRVDQTQARAAWEAYQEYIGVVTEPIKKAKLRGESLQLLLDANDVESAITESRKVLAAEPDDPEATRILGLALFVSGDRTKYEEAARYLQLYVDTAPANDPHKAAVKELLNSLKTVEGVQASPKGTARTEAVTSEPSGSRNEGARESSAPGTGRRYIRGPRGGCYYISSSGRKVYVDRSLCK